MWRGEAGLCESLVYCFSRLSRGLAPGWWVGGCFSVDLFGLCWDLDLFDCCGAAIRSSLCERETSQLFPSYAGDEVFFCSGGREGHTFVYVYHTIAYSCEMPLVQGFVVFFLTFLRTLDTSIVLNLTKTM